MGVKGINHSQFVDDTLFLEVASTIVARRFKVVLNSFLNSSRGKVNNRKSQIYDYNISNSKLQAISRILVFPCVETWSSFNYLGMLISIKNLTSQVWKGFLGKMEKLIW
jgi:hypothetical protein